MRVSDIGPVFTARDRQDLRRALENRRRQLSSAAQLYARSKQNSAARAALFRRTQDDLEVIEAALARLDEVGFGESFCAGVGCLTLQPLALHCDDCESGDTRTSVRPPHHRARRRWLSATVMASVLLTTAAFGVGCSTSSSPGGSSDTTTSIDNSNSGSRPFPVDPGAGNQPGSNQPTPNSNS